MNLRAFLLSLFCVSASAAAAQADAVRYALGQVESGNVDGAIGRHGEISRFQIRKPLWHRHRKERDYRNAQSAWTVASEILAERKAHFREVMRREPTVFETYVLWNAPAYVTHPTVRVAERARRFENLVNAYMKQ